MRLTLSVCCRLCSPALKINMDHVPSSPLLSPRETLHGNKTLFWFVLLLFTSRTNPNGTRPIFLSEIPSVWYNPNQWALATVGDSWVLVFMNVIHFNILSWCLSEIWFGEVLVKPNKQNGLNLVKKQQRFCWDRKVCYDHWSFGFMFNFSIYYC